MPAICRTRTPISLSSYNPSLDFLQKFIYLSTSMWSKRLMKQQGACCSCGSNNMEIAFTGHCVAPQQPVLNWQKLSDLQQQEQIVLNDLPFFFLPSQACHRPSSPLSYCRSHSARPGFTDGNQPIWIERCHFLICLALWCHCFVILNGQTFSSPHAKCLSLNCGRTSCF